MSQFRKDLQFGNEYEVKSLKYLDYDEVVPAPKRRFSDYDFYTIKDGIRINYEVKADRLSHFTKNFAIEFKCNNKPSGISTTKSNFYMYHIVELEKCYKIPTSVIKDMIKNKIYKRIVNGGDGHRSKMYLIDEGYFKDYLVTE